MRAFALISLPALAALTATLAQAAAPAAHKAGHNAGHKTAAPAAGRDWAATVTRTPLGAYVLGNPAARVRLVEYASLTCSHCAAFAAEGWPALRGGYLRDGRVNIEFRHAVRDPADLAASLLVRCGGARGFFGATERVLAAQGDWLPRAAAALDAGSGQGAGADTPAARNAVLATTATAAGLPQLLGLSPAAASACLANPAEQAALGRMSEEAWGKRRIGGTPAFLINDTAVSGTTWAAVEPLLAAALR